jgi:hypothetical protein
MLFEHKDEVFQKLLEETEEWRMEELQNQNRRQMDGSKNIDGNSRMYGNQGSPVRNSVAKDENMRLSGSPNPIKSPGRIPPMGVFTVTSPERERERERERDRERDRAAM